MNQTTYLRLALSSVKTASLVSRFLIFYLYPWTAPSLRSVSWECN